MPIRVGFVENPSLPLRVINKNTLYTPHQVAILLGGSLADFDSFLRIGGWIHELI